MSKIRFLFSFSLLLLIFSFSHCSFFKKEYPEIQTWMKQQIEEKRIQNEVDLWTQVAQKENFNIDVFLHLTTLHNKDSQVLNSLNPLILSRRYSPNLLENLRKNGFLNHYKNLYQLYLQKYNSDSYLQNFIQSYNSKEPNHLEDPAVVLRKMEEWNAVKEVLLKLLQHDIYSSLFFDQWTSFDDPVFVSKLKSVLVSKLKSKDPELVSKTADVIAHLHFDDLKNSAKRALGSLQQELDQRTKSNTNSDSRAKLFLSSRNLEELESENEKKTKEQRQEDPHLLFNLAIQFKLEKLDEKAKETVLKALQITPLSQKNWQEGLELLIYLELKEESKAELLKMLQQNIWPQYASYDSLIDYYFLTFTKKDQETFITELKILFTHLLNEGNTEMVINITKMVHTSIERFKDNETHERFLDLREFKEACKNALLRVAKINPEASQAHIASNLEQLGYFEEASLIWLKEIEAGKFESEPNLISYLVNSVNHIKPKNSKLIEQTKMALRNYKNQLDSLSYQEIKDNFKISSISNDYSNLARSFEDLEMWPEAVSCLIKDFEFLENERSFYVYSLELLIEDYQKLPGENLEEKQKIQALLYKKLDSYAAIGRELENYELRNLKKSFKVMGISKEYKNHLIKLLHSPELGYGAINLLHQEDKNWDSEYQDKISIYLQNYQLHKISAK